MRLWGSHSVSTEMSSHPSFSPSLKKTLSFPVKSHETLRDLVNDAYLKTATLK